MKLKISAVIDVPDECLVEGSKFASAIEVVHDAITGYVRQKHTEDALHWCVKSEKNPDDVSAKQIFEFHGIWRERCLDLNWIYEEVK